VTDQAPALSPQTRRPAGHRHRVVGALARHDQTLEQRPHRSDAAVHRRRRRPPSAKRHHRPTAGHPVAMPVQVVEQVRRRDIAQRERSISQEPCKVRQIERVRPHRCRREPPNTQVIEEAVPRLHDGPVTDKVVTSQRTNDTNMRHHGLSSIRVSGRPSDRWWMSHQRRAQVRLRSRSPWATSTSPTTPTTLRRLSTRPSPAAQTTTSRRSRRSDAP
jgi:hypothetical protein